MKAVARSLWTGLFAPLLVLLPAIALCATPDIQDIVRRSVASNDVDWRAALDYSYEERDREGNSTKTYEVTMIEGSPYQRLILINGKPLTAQVRAHEEMKFQETLATRRSESKHQRGERLAKFESDRKRDHVLMEQLTIAFDFKLMKEARMGPYNVYILRATPRRGYQPPNMQSQALLGMEGQLWIDKNTFQWVKVTARVIRPVSIEGILAQVEPGTYFELEKLPVSEGIWLPKHFVMKSRSKIFFLIAHNTQADETYFNYRKIQPIPSH